MESASVGELCAAAGEPRLAARLGGEEAGGEDAEGGEDPPSRGLSREGEEPSEAGEAREAGEEMSAWCRR